MDRFTYLRDETEMETWTPRYMCNDCGVVLWMMSVKIHNEWHDKLEDK